MPTNTLDKARGLIEQRLAEINDERSQLERALAELGKAGGGGRGPGRPRGSKSRGSAAGTSAGSYKAKRRRRGGTRAEQALKHITENPGISASDIAAKMDIAPNYMYRVMSDLKKAGAVRKDGRGYYPSS